jgi:plastocyanin
VTIEHFAFSPADVAVTAGDTIVFVNKDIVPHTATATDNSWTTGEIAHGATARVKLPAKAGPDFFCKFHPVMKGHLTIAPVR